MANSMLTPSVIAKEAIVQLENNIVFGQQVYRDYSNEFVKVGDTISVRRPVNFTVTDGATVTLQDVTEGKTDVTIDKQKHVAWAFSSKDLTLTIDEYSERYIKPAMIQLANQVDVDLAGLYTKVPSWVGTPGALIDSFADFAKGPERLDTMAVPQDRFAALSPADAWALIGNQTTLNAERKVTSAYERARLGMVAGTDTAMSQNVQTFTTGARGGTPLVAGADQVSTYATVKNTMTQTLNIDGASNSITGWAKAGDVFTIAGVYAVNPITKATQSFLRQFVVTADAASNGSGAVALSIYPAIITTGAYQNVSAAPADNAAITLMGSASTGYTQNMVFHKNAFALVMRPLEMPDGAAWKARETYKGFSIRLVKDYDFTNDKDQIRLDILYGVAAVDPRLATRLSGT